MKKILFLLILIASLSLGLAGCGASSVTEDKQEENKGEIKALVVYFSATENTEKVASEIRQVTGADIFRIEPKIPYTEEDLDYHDEKSRCNLEMDDETTRPEVKEKVENMEQYDLIYLGHPIWWGTNPRIINTFIELHEDALKGKTVVTFCTSGGSGIATADQELREAYPDIEWIEGRRFEPDVQRSEIEKWISQLKK